MGYEVVDFVFVVVEFFFGGYLGGEIGVVVVIGGFGVGEYYVDFVFGQIVLVLDVFWVVFVYQEGGGGVVGVGIVGQLFVLVFGNQVVFVVQYVDVGDLVEGDYVCFQFLEDGVGLFGRVGVGLFDGDVFVGLFFLVGLEFWVIGLEQFLCDIVGVVQDGLLGGGCGGYGQQNQRELNMYVCYFLNVEVNEVIQFI